MNKYIIPICNLVNTNIFIKVVLATSIDDCEDKIMNDYSEKYDRNFYDYEEFLEIMDSEYDIAIGDIIDIETI